MKTIEVNCYDEFETAQDALQFADASGRGKAIMIGGKYLLVPEAEIDRLETAGVEFAKPIDHEMPDGTFRIMTVPVKD